MRPGSFETGLEEVDIRRAVIIVGSGAAGLTAALAAKEAGADVTVLEATLTIGGSSALSGGALWAPNNHVQAEIAAKDSTEQARAYLYALAFGEFSFHLADTFIDQVPRALKWLESVTPLRLTVMPCPDCHSEFPGAMRDFGRSLEPSPVHIASHVVAMRPARATPSPRSNPRRRHTRCVETRPTLPLP